MEALSDHFPFISGAEKPGIPFSTIIPFIIPFSSFAHTTAMSARGELVIHILDPFNITSSPSSTILVNIPEGFDP